jgi:hypothetical protein
MGNHAQQRGLRGIRGGAGFGDGPDLHGLECGIAGTVLRSDHTKPAALKKRNEVMKDCARTKVRKGKA